MDIPAFFILLLISINVIIPSRERGKGNTVNYRRNNCRRLQTIWDKKIVTGCLVHGSGFTVGLFPLFMFLEIVDESTNGSTCSSGLFVNIFHQSNPWPRPGLVVLFIESPGAVFRRTVLKLT